MELNKTNKKESENVKNSYYSTFDIIFLDIDMTGMNGIETAKKIREEDKTVKIVYVTNYTDYLMVLQ
ncbi:response regulator [Romboutsia sp.]|uniref:response regulator n=1 Tax=Romboutsia sp. TaxID=1965302 RepID=UPI003F3EEF84